MRRFRLCVLVACCTALAVPAAPAVAQDSGQALALMVKQLTDTGRIDACDFTTKQLEGARESLPPDIEQYAPDIGTAIDAAVQTRARGGCRKSGAKEETGGAAAGGAPGTTAPPDAPQSAPAVTTPQATTVPAMPGATTTPQPTPDLQPAPAAADAAIPEAVDAARVSSTSASDAPAPLVLLVVLGALLVALAALAGAVRWLGWEPAWLEGARHATAEAGWRTGAAWAEFTDWVRLGR